MPVAPLPRGAEPSPLHCGPQISWEEMLRVQDLRLSSPAFTSRTHVAMVSRLRGMFVFGSMTHGSRKAPLPARPAFLQPKEQLHHRRHLHQAPRRCPRCQASGQATRGTQEAAPPHPSPICYQPGSALPHPSPRKSFYSEHASLGRDSMVYLVARGSGRRATHWARPENALLSPTPSPTLGAGSARHGFHRACVHPWSWAGKNGEGLSPLKALSASLSWNSNFQNPVSPSLQLERPRARLGSCPGLGLARGRGKGNQTPWRWRSKVWAVK